MTWTKLPDEWTDRREFSGLDAETRWHYLCMLTFASRGNYLDGVLSISQAQRASDHPNPDAALARLEEVGLIELSPSAPIVRLTEIDVHIPPPSKRSDATGAERQRRKRAHDKGDHTLCLPTHCPHAAGNPVTHRDAVTGAMDSDGNNDAGFVSRVTPSQSDAAKSLGKRALTHPAVTRAVTRDTGTGRDVTANTTQAFLKVGDVTANPVTGEVLDEPQAKGSPVGDAYPVRSIADVRSAFERAEQNGHLDRPVSASDSTPLRLWLDARHAELSRAGMTS